MRERQRLVIDRQTGDASLSAEVIDDNADFAARIAGLKESVPDIGPVEARLLTSVCDGCGARAELDFDNPKMPPGWASADTGDYCPGCQAPTC
jgi:hypothetical protein